jgi:apolipoprotein D and lipocalin family protein
MKILILLMTMIPFHVSCAGSRIALPTVENVDVQKYLGKWYEVSSFPQSFQKGCTATNAEYSMREDGGLKVVNTCHLDSPDGKLKKATGRAWIKDKKSNAKLKVQFFLSRFKIPFLSGNYWILDLDENYESVLVGDPTRKYLWILSRDPKLDQVRYDELVAKAEELKFDTRKLVKTIH